MSLDRTNRRLIEILQRDARTTFADLARSVDRAESTIRERLAALERTGVVRGYRADVSPPRVGLHAHAFVRAQVDWGRVQEVARALAAVPQVTRVSLTTGPKPLEAEVYARDLHELEIILERHLSSLGLEDIEMALVVGEMVGPRPVNLPEEPEPSVEGARAAVTATRWPTGTDGSPRRRLEPQLEGKM